MASTSTFTKRRSEQSDRYHLRDEPSNIVITPQQIINTFYGAFFEPILEAKTNEFSINFCDDDTFRKKFQRHWKSLLYSEKKNKTIRTFTICIEKIKFITVKYIPRSRTERFLILEPEFTDLLISKYGKKNLEPEKSKDNELLVKIQLDRLGQYFVKSLQFDQDERKFYEKFVGRELKKPTLILGHVFSHPEFKRALINLDYVTNALNNMKQSEFVRKDQKQSSSKSPSKKLKKQTESGKTVAINTTARLMESYKSLLPEKATEFKTKTALAIFKKQHEAQKESTNNVKGNNVETNYTNNVQSCSSALSVTAPIYVNISVGKSDDVKVDDIKVGSKCDLSAINTVKSLTHNSTIRSTSGQLECTQQKLLYTSSANNFHLLKIRINQINKIDDKFLLRITRFALNEEFKNFADTGNFDIIFPNNSLKRNAMNSMNCVLNFGEDFLSHEFLCAASTLVLDHLKLSNISSLISSMKKTKVCAVSKDIYADFSIAESFYLFIRPNNLETFLRHFEICDSFTVKTPQIVIEEICAEESTQKDENPEENNAIRTAEEQLPIKKRQNYHNSVAQPIPDNVISESHDVIKIPTENVSQPIENDVPKESASMNESLNVNLTTKTRPSGVQQKRRRKSSPKKSSIRKKRPRTKHTSIPNPSISFSRIKESIDLTIDGDEQSPQTCISLPTFEETFSKQRKAISEQILSKYSPQSTPSSISENSYGILSTPTHGQSPMNPPHNSLQMHHIFSEPDTVPSIRQQSDEKQFLQQCQMSESEMSKYIQYHHNCCNDLHCNEYNCMLKKQGIISPHPQNYQQHDFMQEQQNCLINQQQKTQQCGFDYFKFNQQHDFRQQQHLAIQDYVINEPMNFMETTSFLQHNNNTTNPSMNSTLASGVPIMHPQSTPMTIVRYESIDDLDHINPGNVAPYSSSSSTNQISYNNQVMFEQQMSSPPIDHHWFNSGY